MPDSPARSVAMVGRTIAHYQVLDKLGVVAMGEVGGADDSQPDRDVAL